MRLIDADTLKVDRECGYAVIKLEDLEQAPCIDVKTIYRSGRDEAITEVLAIVEEIEKKPSGLLFKLDTCYLIKQRIKAMFNY